ncbi:MAG: molybdopterin-dependent oxidoreductase [Spirosomataceae bacterium]
MAKKIIKKHPLAIRWMHWFNFPLLTIMIWSGLMIYWANRVYSIDIGEYRLFHFFPEWVYKLLNLPYRLAEGMAYHFVFMWLFILNGFMYVTYTLVSGEWRYLVPQKNTLRDSWQVLLHDLKIRKTAPSFIKYNAAQRLAYTMIIVMGVGSVLTGFAIYKPIQYQWLMFLFGGYKTARLVHFYLTIGYVIFFVIHLLQVIRAGWNNFNAMITGVEMTKAEVQPIPTDFARRTWISYAVFTVAGGAGYAAWRWLHQQPKSMQLTGSILKPLREGLEVNEKLFQALYSPKRLVQEYTRTEAAEIVRINGRVGLNPFPPDAPRWTLQIKRLNGEILQLSLDDLRKLPKTEVVFEFKCIEGWSQISAWAGVKLSDVLLHFGLTQEVDCQYVGMVTPDRQYYVGIDMPSALHPQTILSYEMNGQPLSISHGAPLRLIIPVKYGVKHLKRVGTIFFDNNKPADYWAERGYDYYCGL